MTLNCAAIVVELDESHEGEEGVQTPRHVEGGGSSHLLFRPAATAMLHALEPRIAARTLRVCVHDERKATMLQRIFRRLDTGDGRTMDDLGLLKMQGGAEGATTRACRLTAAAMCWPLHRR